MQKDLSELYAPWFDLNHPMNRREHRRPSIAELEALLNSDDEVAIEILPNGEIRAVGTGEKIGIKPLTYREKLGGEYGTRSR